MEMIYENLQILRKKGNNLPIYIEIIVQYDKKKEADYYLNKKKSSIEQIEIFLLDAKNDYIEKLDSYYKEKNHLRYLYGKLFINMVDYLINGNLDKIMDILRFILNKNNDEVFKAAKPACPQIEDYVTNYSYYNKQSLENIYSYLVSFFDVNDKSLGKHYESILMKEEKKYKGIFSYECENNSTGKFIYELFWQKNRPKAYSSKYNNKHKRNNLRRNSSLFI